MIYVIANFLSNQNTYVVPNQNELEEIANYLESPNIVIGDEITAKEILDKTRQEYLNANNFQFTCYKEYPTGSNTNYAADLATEPKNTNINYFVFDPVAGKHVECIGTEKAIAVQNEIKIHFLDWSGLTTTEIESVEAFKSQQNVPKMVVPYKTMSYLGVTLNFYKAKLGHGLPQHQHTYNHATVCIEGSCKISTQHYENVLTPDSELVDFEANKWHEITALEDNTVFVNIFPSQIQDDHY